MRVDVDTNVLVRAAVRDDKKQTIAAMRIVAGAEMVAIAVRLLISKHHFRA